MHENANYNCMTLVVSGITVVALLTRVATMLRHVVARLYLWKWLLTAKVFEMLPMTVLG